MAKRMKSKIQPAVQTMLFTTEQIPAKVEGVSGEKSFYIDISQCASIMNRRFYRQGLNWAVNSIKILSGGFQGAVIVQKLPNTWVMSNAWEKVFRAWSKQQKEVLENIGDGVKAKFNDFKIYADPQHTVEGFNRNLIPLDGEYNVASPGEWQPSQLVIPNFTSPGTNYEPYLTAVGNDIPSVSFSLIDLYQKSRGVPHSPDPDVPADVTGTGNILNMMFDVGDNNQDVLDNVVGKNNDLPYVQDDYPGGDTQLPALQIHDYNTITGTTIGSETVSKGGNFPCGLIKLRCLNDGNTPANIVVQLDLVPGMHRGYLAESMTEM